MHKIDDFEWINGAVKSIKLLKDLGFLIIVVTNQSGVFRGFYTENEVKKLHEFMNNELKNKHGVKIDDFFFFSTDDPKITKFNQTRRKPSPGMIIEATQKYNINKSLSFLIGDKESDIMAAKNAGITGFLFEGGNLFDKIQEILKELEI